MQTAVRERRRQALCAATFWRLLHGAARYRVALQCVALNCIALWLLLPAGMICLGAGAAKADEPSADPAEPVLAKKDAGGKLSVTAEQARALLKVRCLTCHGPEQQEGNFRLDTREGILRGGDQGPAVAPGAPAKSLLIKAIRHADESLTMPPKEKLSAAEIALLEEWIRVGAPFPTPAPARGEAAAPEPAERIGDAWHDTRNPIVRIFGGERLDLWSLRPVKRPQPPEVSDPRWSQSPIDRFVAAGGKGGALPAEADRRTLARRVAYDLTGLPLPPPIMARFVADPREDAYERLVDELLASPRYGEHMARMWLDVVRYSDSNGFDWDEFRPQAWRYRDYVIRSFNADKPFDRFLREQLAGDELLSGPPRNAEEQDALIATGYLRMGPQDNAAGLFDEQARARAELMADLVETTASAMLGLSFSCCRCHDHKYDPLSQADHFRMRAFFEGVKYGDDLPLNLAAEQDAIRSHNAGLDSQINNLRERKDGVMSPTRARLRGERIARLSPEEQAKLKVETASSTDEDKRRIAEIEARIEIKDEDLKSALPAEDQAAVEHLDRQIKELESSRKRFDLGLLMSDSPDPPSSTHVLYQGDYRAPREAVVPGYLSALDPNPAAIARGPNPQTQGRRLTLAHWIASADNPLTARVIVNRIWQGHFGEGLVASPNDFGLAGERPSHPALLDWLAAEFVSDGWSIKRLQRRIVLSAMYRQQPDLEASKAAISQAAVSQAAASEPPAARSPASVAATEALTSVETTENGSAAESKATPRPADFWRRRRLTAEQLRDSLLVVSGLLTSKAEGAPIWPELPDDILQANPAFLDDNAEKTKGWYPSPAEQQHARSIFLIQKRTVRVPLMETFDLPENVVSCARRNVSTVAPQALTLLNSPLATEAAKAFAARVINEAGPETSAQVERAFVLALGRAPAAGERESCKRLVENRSLPELCRVLFNLNEFLYLD